MKEALSNPTSEEVTPCPDKDSPNARPIILLTDLVGSSVCPQVPAILVSSLHKEYDERREFLLGRRIKKVATKHVSLCIGKGLS